MRTKHILFTMALGAAFAACTSEEDFKVAVNDTNANLAIRPVVGSEFVLGGDEAATRLGLGSGARPVWGQNDKVGAAIIDVPTYASESNYASEIEAGKKALELYNIVEYYGCNNAFTTSDGGKTWSAEHPMVEGNYLFYAPYQEGLALRSPLVVAVPRIQQATSEKKALEDFYNGDNIVQVGYKFITNTETQRPSVTLYNIFAYPQFTITNNFNGGLFNEGTVGTKYTEKYTGTIHVDSVQFVNVAADKVSKSNALVVGGQLLNSNHTDQDATEATSGLIAELKQKANGFDADGDWWDLDKMLKDVQTVDLLSTSNRIMNGRYKMADVITTLVVDQDVESGKSIDLYCVMPAYRFNFTNDQLMAKLYVTINNVQYEICDASVSAAGAIQTSAATAGYVFDAKKNAGLTTLSLMAGQRLPAEALRVTTDENGNQEYAQKTDVKDLLTIDLSGKVAVRMGALNEGITTTAQLIDKIQNAANGTAWAEGDDALDGSTKGFKIAPVNSVVINSALINALATDNQNEGGSFTITTVVPISNDVKVKAVNGTKVTFVSNTNKEYDITLKDAVTDGSSAGNKYAIINAQVPSDFNENTVAIVTGTQSISATKLKSLHVSASGNATLNAALLAGNIRVDGTLTTASNDVTADEIYNSGTINVSKAITGTVSNNGVIDAKAAVASVTVTDGMGKVLINESVATNGVKIGSSATQEVVYVCSSTLATTQIEAAAALSAVNAIQAKGATTLVADDIAKLANIKKIIIDSDINTHATATFNMTGITVELTKAATWAGTNVAQTIVQGVHINLGSYQLDLNNIAVNGTSENTADTGKIVADGISATWNGGASGQN